MLQTRVTDKEELPAECSLLQVNDQGLPEYIHGGLPAPALSSSGGREQALRQQGQLGRKLGPTNDESSLTVQRTLERQALAKKPTTGAGDCMRKATGR